MNNNPPKKKPTAIITGSFNPEKILESMLGHCQQIMYTNSPLQLALVRQKKTFKRN